MQTREELKQELRDCGINVSFLQLCALLNLIERRTESVEAENKQLKDEMKHLNSQLKARNA